MKPLRILGVPLLATSLILHPQSRTAHSQFSGVPLLVGWSAEAMAVTATASTIMLHG
jgi:hypothetical protein